MPVTMHTGRPAQRLRQNRRGARVLAFLQACDEVTDLEPPAHTSRSEKHAAGTAMYFR